MDPMEAIRETFFQECEEGLVELEQGLLLISGGEADSETVNAVFRAVHSVKGGAGAFGLEALVRFAHVFETTLDHLRSNRLESSPALAAVMLRAADVLSDLLRAARGGPEASEAVAEEVLKELAAFDPEGEGAGGADDGDGFDDFDFAPIAFAPVAFEPVGEEMSEEPATALGGWRVGFRPLPALYANGNEAGLLLRELERLGPMTVTLDDSAVPGLDALDCDGAYLGWTLQLDAGIDEAAVREVFDFVEGDCELSVEREGSPSAEPAIALPEPDAAQVGGEAEPLDIMALIARAQEAEPAAAPVRADAASPAAPGETPESAPAPAAAKKEAAPAAQSIRVELDRVDRLIDLVGELVIHQAMLNQRVSEAGLARTSAAVVALDQLEQLTREIQDSVMAIRAQPVKSVLQRMPRLVREVAAMTGKQVRLVTEGENTEVDKTVIERLTDPLTHMIRNAIDHGLERPDVRVANGKPAEGVVRLSALHRSGRIVIEVADDGAGINRPRVRKIAVDKGLILPDAVLTDEEVDNLIFMPGFSTAETVSDISGRGVGMDVVRRSIQALGGRISIASRPGQGSTFTLSLPLTLAVLDGMVVSAAGQTLVAPLTSIVETLQPRADALKRVGDAQVICVRNLYLPLVDVGVALGWRDRPTPAEEGVALLVETDSGAQCALLVDAIQGQRQVVIKSLEANYRHVPGIAAATILGDGRVALILDVDAVVARARQPASVSAPPAIPAHPVSAAG